MDTAAVIERVQRIGSVRATPDPHVATVRRSLGDIVAVRAWADAAEAALIDRLGPNDPFSEATVAAASRCSVSAACATTERADTLLAAPEFAAALGDASITSGHVDELTRASKKLDDGQRTELFARTGHLAVDAGRDTIEQFRRRPNRVVNTIQRNDGEVCLERQRKATSLSTWVDGDGLWNLRAKYDPSPPPPWRAASTTRCPHCSPNLFPRIVRPIPSKSRSICARHAHDGQRRALRALYTDCAIAGCTVHYDRLNLDCTTWCSGHTVVSPTSTTAVCSPPSPSPRRQLGTRTRRTPRTHHPIPRRNHPDHRTTHPARGLTNRTSSAD